MIKLISIKSKFIVLLFIGTCVDHLGIFTHLQETLQCLMYAFVFLFSGIVPAGPKQLHLQICAKNVSHSTPSC